MCWESICEKLNDCIVWMSKCLWSAQILNAAFLPPFHTSVCPLLANSAFGSCRFGILSGFVLDLQIYPSLPLSSILPYSLHIHDGPVLLDLADRYLFWPRGQWQKSGYLWAGITAVQLACGLSIPPQFPPRCIPTSGFEVLNFSPRAYYSYGEYKVGIPHMGCFLH